MTTGVTHTVNGSALWASFWTILGGFIRAGLGGMIGGAVTMPANAQLFGRSTIVRERVEEEDDVPGSSRAS